jgi:hypothetical protein
MRLDELISRKCHLTMSEYTVLTSWLPAPFASRVGEPADSDILEVLEDAAAEASITCGRNGTEYDRPSKRRRHGRVQMTKLELSRLLLSTAPSALEDRSLTCCSIIS